MQAYSFHIHITIVYQLQKRENHNSLPPPSKQKRNLSHLRYEEVFRTQIASVCLTYIGLGQSHRNSTFSLNLVLHCSTELTSEQNMDEYRRFPFL